ncbi:hypothetical protein [Azomonas macrocytogenes]|uniref:Uncharacterized protein n=1 Tax=Azomonas macrocytogenes TaxID=69962 RepID=A0A839T364_AZOMA|nr:hypothetical protein [Azomonas macrocytogenes]MBB3102916.1 hypothetical protein [Azomonas macrocytogenes]
MNAGGLSAWTRVMFPNCSRTLVAVLLGVLFMSPSLYLHYAKGMQQDGVFILFSAGGFSCIWWLLLGSRGSMLAWCGGALRLPNLGCMLLRFGLGHGSLSIIVPTGLLAILIPEIAPFRLFGALALGAGLGFFLSSVPASSWLLVWLALWLVVNLAGSLAIDWQGLLADRPERWLLLAAGGFLLGSLAW